MAKKCRLRSNVFYTRAKSLRILSSHIENGQEFIEDIAHITPISDELATTELIKSKGDEVVYHTANENIVLEVRQDVGLMRFDYHENQV